MSLPSILMSLWQWAKDCRIMRWWKNVPHVLLTMIWLTSFILPGTTGEPKGVMLHHSCYLEQFHTHDERLTTMTDKDVSMNFLPLTQYSRRHGAIFVFIKRVQIWINLRPADIQTTIKEIRPTLMCSVPRFWEKV